LLGRGRLISWNESLTQTDVSDAEWALVAPYLTLMTEDASQREHPLREVFNGLRWIVRAGSSWRMMPHDLPPWDVVYQQTQRWLKAGVFEALIHDLRAVLRIAEGRQEMPTAAIFDSRTMQSTPESGGRKCGRCGPRARNQTRSRKTSDGQKRLRFIATTLGGGTKLWLDVSLSPLGA
jgi:transposase